MSHLRHPNRHQKQGIDEPMDPDLETRLANLHGASRCAFLREIAGRCPLPPARRIEHRRTPRPQERELQERRMDG